MSAEFSITREVEFAETDMAGIMHFTHFYRWMEVCEHEFLRSLDLSVDMKSGEDRIGWPRVKTSCRFKRPLRFEDKVELRLGVREVRDRSIVYVVDFWKEENGERVRAASGETVAACVRFDPDTLAMTPVAVPDAFRERMQPFITEKAPQEDG
jgi:YbgC/YbaW family acyl-CoA thioester hydrolase